MIAPIFLTSFVLTWLILLYAKKSRLVDRPNERSSHAVPTPRAGGLSFVVTLLIAFGLSFLFLDGGSRPELSVFFALFGGGSLVAAVGLWDDHSPLPVRWRLLLHTLVALIVFSLVGIPPIPVSTWILDPGWWGLPVAVLAAVWLVNLFNFMDGIDGIAGVEVLTVAGGAILILLAHSQDNFSVFWLAMLTAGVAGFMIWNWSPARIFMGDVASLFLGFLLGLFAVMTSIEGVLNIWAWLILLGVFVVDATWTLIRRMLRGERWYLAHCSHAYQRISMQLAAGSNQPEELARARAHRLVCYGVMGINVFWLLPWAWLSVMYPGWGLLFVVIAFLPLVMVAVRSGAGEAL